MVIDIESIEVEQIKIKPGERALVLKAALMIPLVEIWVRVSGFQRCRNSLQGLAGFLNGRKPENKKDLEQAQRIAGLVDIANRRYSVYLCDCLTQSLVVQYFLTRQQIPSELRVGVRTITGQFESHTWVEHSGVALNEPESVRKIYTEFDCKKSSPSTGNR